MQFVWEIKREKNSNEIVACQKGVKVVKKWYFKVINGENEQYTFTRVVMENFPKKNPKLQKKSRSK